MLNYRITAHADESILEREIPIWVVRRTIDDPEQIVPQGDGTAIYQKRFVIQEKVFLIRVPIAVDKEPAQVLTAYRTSNMSKYWDTTGTYDVGNNHED